MEGDDGDAAELGPVVHNRPRGVAGLEIDHEAGGLQDTGIPLSLPLSLVLTKRY